jgi:hypothetical protein
LIQRLKIHVREGLIISAEILSTLAGIESMPVDFEVFRLLNKRNTSYSLISDRENRVTGLVPRFSDKSRESWSISADSFGPMLTKKSLKASAIVKLSEIIVSPIFNWNVV